MYVGSLKSEFIKIRKSCLHTAINKKITKYSYKYIKYYIKCLLMLCICSVVENVK